MPGPQIKAPQPGQYYFLYEPFSLRGYENHPMTLGTWRAHNPSSTSPTNENEEEDTYPLTPTTSSSPTTLTPAPAPTSDAFSPSQPLLSRSPSPSSSTTTTTTTKPNPNATATAKAPTTLTFWIRPYNGWTRRLRDRCLAGHAHPLILLEGPYGGSPHPLASYDAALLIAGGSGISAAVPYLQACARRTTACDDVEGQQRARARMQLVWAAREEGFMREVVERELGEGLARGAFGVELFCTGDGGEGAVEVRQGRPDVRAIVAETARRVGEEVRGMHGGRRRGRVAVLLCGPPGMARGVEGAVRRAGEEFDCWVDYFDEVFSW